MELRDRKDILLAVRSAGSHSPVDVLALTRHGDFYLIQCKAGKYNPGILKEAKLKFGPLLTVPFVSCYICIKNKKIEYIPLT